MALDECKAAIAASIGRELNDRESGIVARKAIALKQKIDLASDPDAVNKVLGDFADEVKARALIAKRNTALNWRAYSALKAYRKSVADVVKNPGEVTKAIFRGSLFNFAGSKDSLANLAMKESNNRVGSFLADLQSKNLTDYAFSGADDKNIVGAQYDLRNGKEPDPAKYGANAVAVAKSIEQHQEALRLDHNGAGAWITKNGDRLFRRTHDANKIAKAGDSLWGSDGAKAAWTKYVSDRMDWNKAFDGDLSAADPKAKQERLESLWTQFTADRHVAVGTDAQPGVGSRNFGKKQSQARELVFKSPQADLEYQQTFGRGNSVAENVMHGLGSGGKDLALMRKLGPNPEQTLNQWKQDWSQHLRETGDAAGLKQLNDQFDKEMKNTWRLLTGTAGHPADNAAARFMSTIRHTTNTAALGMSIFSLPGDLSLRASMMRQAGAGSFEKNFVKTIGDQFAGSGLGKDAKMRLAAEMGVRIEGAHIPLDPNMVDHVGYGQWAKYLQKVMRVTGHAGWDNRIRTNSLAADGLRHWQLRDTAHADLPGGVRDVMNQFGMGQKEWDVLRKTPGDELENGNRIFSPSGIADHSLDNFKSLVSGGNPSDAQLTRARQTLADSYRNMMGELADRSTSAPSLANQAFMGMGKEMADSGTWQGELYRGALQLKGYVFNYMRNHLGRELFGYSSEYKSLPKAIGDMMRGKNPRGAVGISKLIAYGMATAYVTDSLRDIAVGKSLQDPFGTAEGKGLADQPWAQAGTRAFARQSFGLYSDFLLSMGDPSKSFWEKVGDTTGPELGLASDLSNLTAKISGQALSHKGFDEKSIDGDTQRAFGIAYHNLPGTNLWWSKFATDYMILNSISEQLNPGYQQRLMDRAAKHGQHYLAGSPGMQ